MVNYHLKEKLIVTEEISAPYDPYEHIIEKGNASHTSS